MIDMITQEETFLERLQYFFSLSIKSNTPAALRVTSPNGRTMVSFNFTTPVSIPNYFYQDIPVPASAPQQLIDKEEFLYNLPEELLKMFTYATLETAVDNIVSQLGSPVRLLKSKYPGTANWITSARMIVMIVSEPV